jgi:phosphoglycerate dehydrogenase-like enzyme
MAARHGIDLLVANDEDTMLRALPAMDALWVTPTYYSSAIPRAVALERGALRWIGLTSAGYDVLAAQGVAPGVITTYAAGVHGPAVAEHAVALLLAAVRRLPAAFDRQRDARWDRAIVARLRSVEDMTVTIVGLGAIGRDIARRLRPFGARLIGVSRRGRADAVVDAVFRAERLHEALAQSDAVIVAVAMSEETRHLIDAAAFAAMRPGTVFVNVARGAVVDRAALLSAIAAAAVDGVALDVTDPEPLPPGDPLWNAPDTLITPHLGSFGSRAAGARLAEHLRQNLTRLAAGEPLAGVVDPPYPTPEV